jgi:cell division protein FtsW
MIHSEPRPARRPSAGAVRRAPDYTLLLATAALLGLGLLMVFSASSVEAGVVYHDPFYFFKRQLAWAAIGCVALVFCLGFDYWRWRSLAPAVLAVTLLFLLVVLVPGVGHASRGARRWIGFGPLSFQPSEMAKLTMVIFFSAWLSGRREKLRRLASGLVPYLLMVGAVAGLILAEPDLGTAGALGVTSMVLLFLAGVPGVQLVAVGLAAVPVLAVAIFGSDYRRRRFLAFLDPQADPLGSGYHILQSLYALGSGGLFGAGLGGSLQKYFYLPEQHTDFIFAIIGEELGFIGAALVLSLFFLLIWRGYRVAAGAPDSFSALLAAGVTTMVAVQVIINVGVVTSVLPITGITLPLISFGGSSLVFTMAGIGILANISRYCRT